jgi:monovalent cation/proton antiporter MnhG/PhaG subunit
LIGDVAPWIADALALLGLVVLTLSVYGVLRLPDVTTRIHAAGTAGVMGVVPVLLAAAVGIDAAAVLKALLVGSFLVLTSPIVAHEIGRAAHVALLRGTGDEEPPTL